MIYKKLISVVEKKKHVLDHINAQPNASAYLLELAERDMQGGLRAEVEKIIQEYLNKDEPGDISGINEFLNL